MFDRSVAFDPASNFPAFLKQVPAKWVVYLLTDADDRPVQLLCVKNLRYSLEHRLGAGEPEERTKRVNYRDLVRRVYWRRVDSSFEADAVYWEAARTLFPETYRKISTFRPAWFVHVDPEAKFPRFVRTTDLTVRGGQLIGPLEDKQDAAKLIQLAEDAFDLCRYYNVLTEAPHGKACAYKEMGRCPAPCDGTVAMEEYRRGVASCVNAIVGPADSVTELTRQMRAAAAELKFELAGRIKARIDQLSQFGTGAFRYVRRMQDFRFLSLQRGPREGTAKLFLITPSAIEEVAGLIAEPKSLSDLLRHVLSLAATRAGEAPDDAAADRVGLVAHHLFSPKQTQGVFLRITEVSERSLPQGYRDLRKQKESGSGSGADGGGDGEGVVRELQAPSGPTPPTAVG